ERSAHPGIQVSNHGGAWHSAPDLARRDDPLWRALSGVIIGAVREVFDELAGTPTAGAPLDASIQLWGMVLPAGGYVTVHDHHDAGFSVALYADAGDAVAPPSGALAFVDPRRVPPVSGGRTLFPSTFTLQPRTGM